MCRMTPTLSSGLTTNSFFPTTPSIGCPPIQCDETDDDVPLKWLEFLSAHPDACTRQCTGDSVDLLSEFCSPQFLGDGRCDPACNTNNCNLDDGDCRQLCFAPELTNCTQSLLSNDPCAVECVNPYCAAYPSGPTGVDFSQPDDSYACQQGSAGNSSTNDSACAQSSAHSLFMDPNVEPVACQSQWLNDGLCDDACMTAECSYDAGDCDASCADSDLCEACFSGWYFGLELLQMPSTVHSMNHSFFCNQLWPLFQPFLGIAVDADCNDEVAASDFDHNGQMNFREFVDAAARLGGSAATDGKHRQINCSACTGMEFYNV